MELPPAGWPTCSVAGRSSWPVARCTCCPAWSTRPRPACRLPGAVAAARAGAGAGLRAASRPGTSTPCTGSTRAPTSRPVWPAGAADGGSLAGARSRRPAAALRGAAASAAAVPDLGAAADPAFIGAVLRLLTEDRPPREGSIRAALASGARAVPATVTGAVRMSVGDGPMRLVLLLTGSEAWAGRAASCSGRCGSPTSRAAGTTALRSTARSSPISF